MSLSVCLLSPPIPDPAVTSEPPRPGNVFVSVGGEVEEGGGVGGGARTGNKSEGVRGGGATDFFARSRQMVKKK